MNVYDFIQKVTEKLVDHKSGALLDSTMKHALPEDLSNQYRFVHVLRAKLVILEIHMVTILL